MWIRRLTAAAGLVLLGACTSAESDSGEQPSTAAKAPESEFTVGCPQFTDPRAGDEQDRLPALSLECLGSEGDPVAISGKPAVPTVVNLWASWCGPCIDEMPLLDELSQQSGGKVAVLGIVTSDNRSAATSFAVDMGLTFPSVLDPKGQVVSAEGLVGLPVTMMVDTDGKITYRHIGPYKTIDDLRQDVAEHLGVAV